MARSVSLGLWLFWCVIAIHINISASLVNCYKHFDFVTSTCNLKSNIPPQDDARKCCQWSHVMGFAPIESESANTSIASNCNSCKTVRNEDEVFCFNQLYYVGERSCHELQSLMATSAEDCCIVRTGPPQGFAVSLDFRNATVPSYHCSICKEHYAKASEWTEWSDCNVLCNGGRRKRQFNCKENEMTMVTKCHGEKTQEEPCNEQPCSQKNILEIVIIITLALSVIILWLYIYIIHSRNHPKHKWYENAFFCCLRLKRNVIESPKNNLSYSMSALRRLPDAPSTEVITSKAPKDDYHIYEDIGKTDYDYYLEPLPNLRPPSYLEMK